MVAGSSPAMATKGICPIMPIIRGASVLRLSQTGAAGVPASRQQMEGLLDKKK